MKYALLVIFLSRSVVAADSLIAFTWGGGKSPIVSARVEIDSTGEVGVRYRKLEKAEATHSFTLSDDELSAIRTLIRVSKLTDRPVSVPDAGDSTLIVDEIRIANPEGPLVDALWRLINQGIVTVELESDLFQARNALTPLAAAQKVYCPRLLAAPLKRALAKNNNQQQIEWGLEGLAYVLSEEQWSGYIGRQLEDATDARRFMLLRVVTGHPFHSNVPEGHSRSILPLLVGELDADQKFDAAADDAFGSICRYVAEYRYEAARPILERVKAKGGESSAAQWAAWSLDMMASSATTGGANIHVTEPAAGVESNQTQETLEGLSGPERVMKAMDEFRQKLPEPQGLNEQNGLGVADVDGTVHPDSHLKGVGVRLGVKTRAECIALMTYLKDKDPKMRRISAFALDDLLKAYPSGMSSSCLEDVASESHRTMVSKFLAEIDKLPN